MEKGAERTSQEKRQVCLGVVAHVDAGKTTLSESLLYTAGSIRSMGRVDHGDTFLDTDEMERQRGITIFSRQARLTYRDTELTLLDTPGHVDFSAEMERVLWVLDAAVLVISGADGVQGHTRTLWKLLSQLQIPTFLFVNKMDVSHLSREALQERLQRELDDGCVDFSRGQAEDWPEDLREHLAMCSEELMDSYLAGEAFPRELLRKAVSQRKLFPCIYGSALKNQGVDRLLDVLCLLTGERPWGEAFSARVFKIGRDSRGERLTYLKLTGGRLRVKDEISYQAAEGQIREKVNQIRQYSGEKFDTLEEVCPGEICAVTGLSKTMSGMALGEETLSSRPRLESVLSYRVIPPGDCRPQKLLEDLRLLEEDPQLHVRWEESTQEIYVNLMGEVQTQVLQTMILDRFGTAVSFGEGSILYQETITTAAEGVGHFEPLRHYAEAHVLWEPLPQGSGVEVAMDCPTDLLDRNWQRLICTHLKERGHPGVLTGAPVTDLRMTVVAGKAHAKHTEGGDFRQAAYRAVRQGLKKAGSILLEPWYHIVLKVPGECVGRAMTDLNRMEGKMEPPVVEGDMAILEGAAPVACVGNYGAQVAAYSGGRGELSLEPAGYFPCHNTQEVVEAAAYDSDRDEENPTGSVFCSHGAGYPVPWYEVEERMHVPLTGKAEKWRRENAGEEPEEETADEAAIIAEAKARAKRLQQKPSGGYDGYGGLEKDLEEIFVREFGEIRRPAVQAEKQTVRYEREKRIAQAREAYRKSHGQQAEKPKKDYLLVDGYNVIYAQRELTELARCNLEAARGKLADLLCNYQGYLGCELILVFDAYRVKGNPGEVQRYHNIYIVYTREAETADAYIERTTHEIVGQGRVTVATSDALEQMIVMGEGARRMSSRELFAEMERVEQEALASYRQGQ